MSNVIKLPTAATSYFTVRKDGPFWAVQIVTPAPGKAHRTTIISASDKADAFDMGRKAAARSMRPFKVRGVTA